MIIRTHQDLEVFQIAYKNAMDIFQTSKSFPKEEKYAITDQIRRSSRSVCANIAEAFRRRRYVKSLVSVHCSPSPPIPHTLFIQNKNY